MNIERVGAISVFNRVTAWGKKLSLCRLVLALYQGLDLPKKNTLNNLNHRNTFDW